MISKKVEDALNGQLNMEGYSAYLYLSMAAYFESTNLTGMATWMRSQAQEETMHAMKFFDFIHSRAGRVTLGEIPAPQAEWDSPLAAFEAAYEHERKVTEAINKLVDLSVSEHDHATNAFLQWFVTEQVEEEESVSAIVEQLKLIGDSRGAMFWMNKELGKRIAGAEEE